MKHEHIFLGDIHKIHNWEVESMTAREQLVVVGLDIGKICWQKDDDSFWFLKQHSPVVWAQLGVGNAAPGVPTDTVVDVLQIGTVGVDGHMHHAVITTQMIKDLLLNYDNVNGVTSVDFIVTTNDVSGHTHEIGITYSFIAEEQGNRFTVNSISGNDADNHVASFVGHLPSGLTASTLAAGINTEIKTSAGFVAEGGSTFLSGRDPIEPLEVATMQYVDSRGDEIYDSISNGNTIYKIVQVGTAEGGSHIHHAFITAEQIKDMFANMNANASNPEGGWDYATFFVTTNEVNGHILTKYLMARAVLSVC